MTQVTGARLCRLETALGRVAACPEERCPLWEPGGAVLEGRCGLEPLVVDDSPELAGWLLDVRGKLDVARTREERNEAWLLLFRRLKVRGGE